MEQVIKNLKAKEIIYKKSIALLKAYIADKYPEASEAYRTQVFADAVHKIIDDHIREFRRKDQRAIKAGLIKNAASKENFEIVAYDIMKICVGLNIDEETFIEDMTSWINHQQEIPVFRHQTKELAKTVRTEVAEEAQRATAQANKASAATQEALLKQLEEAFAYQPVYDSDEDSPEPITQGQVNMAYEEEMLKDRLEEAEETAKVADKGEEKAGEKVAERATQKVEETTTETEVQEVQEVQIEAIETEKETEAEVEAEAETPIKTETEIETEAEPGTKAATETETESATEPLTQTVAQEAPDAVVTDMFEDMMNGIFAGNSKKAAKPDQKALTQILVAALPGEDMPESEGADDEPIEEMPGEGHALEDTTSEAGLEEASEQTPEQISEQISEEEPEALSEKPSEEASEEAPLPEAERPVITVTMEPEPYFTMKDDPLEPTADKGELLRELKVRLGQREPKVVAMAVVSGLLIFGLIAWLIVMAIETETKEEAAQAYVSNPVLETRSKTTEAAPSPPPEPVPRAVPEETEENDHLHDSLKYKDIDEAALKNWFARNESLIGETPYFETILEVAKAYGVNPLFMFAITGQEQRFVPKNHEFAMTMINNPFNVYGSWERYNTDLEESAQIAARTILTASEGRPEDVDPVAWINATYAEDEQWSVGVTLLWEQLEAEAGH